jgi:hypothetical protein
LEENELAATPERLWKLAAFWADLSKILGA